MAFVFCGCVTCVMETLSDGFITKNRTVYESLLCLPKSKYNTLRASGHLPRYHERMASIVSHIVVVLANRELSDGSVKWS